MASHSPCHQNTPSSPNCCAEPPEYLCICKADGPRSFQLDSPRALHYCMSCRDPNLPSICPQSTTITSIMLYGLGNSSQPIRRTRRTFSRNPNDRGHRQLCRLRRRCSPLWISAWSGLCVQLTTVVQSSSQLTWLDSTKHLLVGKQESLASLYPPCPPCPPILRIPYISHPSYL